MRKRVLAVGSSRRVLRALTSALLEAGFDAQWTSDTATASRRFRPDSVDLVAFGRGVGGEDRRRLKSDFLRGNPAVLFVDGLAPLIPLLVAQVESAFSSQRREARLVRQVASGGGELSVGVRDDCDVEVTLYRLDRLYRTHRDILFSRRVSSGTQRIPLDRRAARHGRKFAVVRANGTEVAVAAL